MLEKIKCVQYKPQYMTIFSRFSVKHSTISWVLVNNPLGYWLERIIIETYQAASGYIRLEYKPVSYVWPYIEPDSDSSDDESEACSAKKMTTC